MYESTQLQELQVLHTTSSIPTTAHKTSNGKQNSPQFRSNHLSNPQPGQRDFFLFFTSSVLEHIVEQSNKYAAECMGEQFQTWQPITVDELCAYFGFMILMGIVRLPGLGDYWKKDMIYHYTPVAERISQDRFYDLHRYLHFIDNSTLLPPHTPGYNKLGKISPIITMLRNRFAHVWNPGKNISIDEAMIPFKGRSSLKQHKVWARADADNGYVSAFEVYTGRKGNTTEKGLGTAVVKGLTEQLHGTYRHVFYNNFFSSVDLALDLLKPLSHGLINNPSRIRIRPKYNPNRSGSNPDRFHMEHV